MSFRLSPRFLFLLVAALCLPAASWCAASEPAALPPGEGFDWRAFLAPFHSVTLHLPIGFITMALILEAYSFLRPSRALRSAITLVLWVSGISAVMVSALGLLRGTGGGYEEAMLKHHEQFGIAVTAVILVAAAVHTAAFRKDPPVRPLVGLYRVLLASSIVLITITGHAGGNLTHGSQYLVGGAPQWVRDWLERLPGGEARLPEARAPGVFADRLLPAFEEKCFSCHGPEKQQGDYRMDSTEALFAAGESELPAIVPGRPLESYLVELVTLPPDDNFAMPPEGKPRLTPEETLLLMQWIWDGAQTGEAP